MHQHRWHWIPIGLVAAGVTAVVVAAAASARVLGGWQVLVYLGCIAAASAAFFFRKKLSAAEIELEELRKHLAAEDDRLASERSQFEELRVAMQQEMTQQATRLDRREQALADRLVTYHEWMEFPQPIDLSK